MSDNIMYEVLKPKTTTDGRGNTKQRLERIAVGFMTKDGRGLRFQLPDGVAISGTVIIMERELKAGEDAADQEDGIPF